MNKKLFSLMVVCMLAMAAFAELPTSGVYRIVNKGYATYCMAEGFQNNTVYCPTTSVKKTDYEQLWQVQEVSGKYTLCNVYTGRYIQYQGSRSQQFATGTKAVGFTFGEVTSNVYTILGDTNGQYLHCDGSKNVVNWYDASIEPTQWTMTPVEISDEEIAAARKSYTELKDMQAKASTYYATMKNYFSDAICSKINDICAAKTDDEMREMMTADNLPESLQDIVIKVKNQKYHSYEKEHRVYDESHPYPITTDAGTWINKLGTYSYCNMADLTGIHSDAKDVLYIFIESIPSNTEVWLGGMCGNDRIGSAQHGQQLHAGLNIIVGSRDKEKQLLHYWTAATVNRTKKLSDFPGLKVMIEGGKASGFMDMKDDDCNDYDAQKYAWLLKDSLGAGYIELRGPRAVFHFPVETYKAIWWDTCEKSIRWYNNVCRWEHELLGVTKSVYDNDSIAQSHDVKGGTEWWPTYFNNRIWALQGADGSNPFATYYNTSFPGIGGVRSSFDQDHHEGFDNWCCGHECGHQNQQLINLQSSTESSNNLFSNVICHQTGYYMSRGETIDDEAEDFRKGITFSHRYIGLTHRMYYQLYLYYHRAQNKTDFYPTLFGLLRDDRMDLWNGNNSQMKWVKKVCQAAGEDLTEFFNAWGFFHPLNNESFGDYTTHTISLTQEEIDACKAEIAKYPKKNNAILFIEDRITTLPRHDVWDPTGTQNQRIQGGGVEVGKAGMVGMFTDFKNRGANATKAEGYLYAASGTSVIIKHDKAQGGVGFLVRNADGELLGFSNNYQIALNTADAAKDYSVYAMNADGTETKILSVEEGGSDADRLEALQNAMTSADAMLALKDDTGKNAGFYRGEYLKTLEDLKAEAQQAIATEQVENYGTIAKNINREILSLKANPSIQIPIMAGWSYSLRNKEFPTYRALASSNKTMKGSSGATINNSKKFELYKGKNGTYFIHSEYAKGYVAAYGDPVKIEAVASTVQPSDTLAFTLTSMGDGTFNIGRGGKYLNMTPSDMRILLWGDGETDGSLWFLEAVEQTTLGKAMAELDEMQQRTDSLVKVAATYTEPNAPMALQATEYSSPYYISTNAPAEDGSNPVANLLDKDSTTCFWSRHEGEAITSSHHLKLSMGAGNTIQKFTFTFQTNAEASTSYPTTIAIFASKNDTTWTRYASNVTGLATYKGGKVYTSKEIDLKDEYKYVRFDVTAVGGSTKFGDKPYFTLAEFGVNNSGITVKQKSEYTTVSKETIMDALNEVYTAKDVLNSGSIMRLEYVNETKTLTEKYNALYEAMQQATGITNIVGGQAKAEDKAYDLTGRRVANPVKGLYIINGQKVVK